MAENESCPNIVSVVTDPTGVDKAAIDDVTAAFFDAFTNANGDAPNVDVLYRLFIPEAVIVSNSGTAPIVYDVAGFVEPRRVLLTGGSLADFSEWEVSEKTEIFGNVAHRLSHYEKSWTASGEPFTGGGAKTIQFVRTPEGWRIASVAWTDDYV